MSKVEIEGVELGGFEWDFANIYKNWEKHKVNFQEAEEIFTNWPRFITYDKVRSQNEDRLGVLGITDTGRKLFAVFTIRNKKIRIISARDQSRKERTDFTMRAKLLGLINSH